MSIGTKIKTLRQSKNLTQNELAVQLFVTRNAISKWETDKGIPSIDNLKQLSQLFDVSLDEIVNEEDRISISVNNNDRVEKIQSMLENVGLFLTYCMNGILLPLALISGNGYDEPVVHHIILPLVFTMIGLISVLREMAWKNVVVSSLLAMLPIYILYDVLLPHSSLGLIGVIHYLLFITSYFIMRYLISFLKNKFESKKLSKILKVISIGIVCVYVIHTTIASISLYYCYECSAPWYLEVIVNTIFYAIPISFVVTLYRYFKHQN